MWLTSQIGEITIFKNEIQDEQLKTFQQLKIALVVPPILILFNPAVQSEINTDASMYRYRGALMQKGFADGQGHPVVYMNRKTSSTEQKYHLYKLEIPSIIEVLKR